jgi:hypothetical protein
MFRRDFYQIEQDLEHTVSKLKETRDTEIRRYLIVKLRLLLVEADYLLLEMQGVGYGTLQTNPI